MLGIVLMRGCPAASIVNFQRTLTFPWNSAVFRRFSEGAEVCFSVHRNQSSAHTTRTCEVCLRPLGDTLTHKEYIYIYGFVYIGMIHHTTAGCRAKHHEGIAQQLPPVGTKFSCRESLLLQCAPCWNAYPPLGWSAERSTKCLMLSRSFGDLRHHLSTRLISLGVFWNRTRQALLEGFLPPHVTT